MDVVSYDFAGIESSNYDKGSCILKGKIVNVSVGECALTDGKVNLNKAARAALYLFNNAHCVLVEPVRKAQGVKKKTMKR